MHQALGTPEILYEILTYFHPYSSLEEALLSDNSRSLLRIATTCKYFSQFALDALWYRMQDLTPLFKLLSNFVSNSNSPGFIRGPIAVKDLDRFLAYGSRINEYWAQDSEAHRISSSAYGRVLHASGRHCLLPRLRRFVVVVPSAREELLFLLHPGLVELKIRARHMYPGDLDEALTAEVLLQSLHERCPDLAWLQASFLDRPNDFRQLAIWQMHKLAHIELHCLGSRGLELPCDFLTLLPSIATLRSVVIGGYSCIPSLPFQKSSPRVTLPNLTSLQVCVDITNLPSMEGTMFGAHHLPTLDTLILEIYATDQRLQPTELSHRLRFLERINDIAPGIRSLRLRHVKGRPCFDMVFALFLPNMPKHLETLEIDRGLFQPLTLADFHRLSVALPVLRHFIYGGWGRWTPRPGPQVLADIACSLTSLQVLEVEDFDAKDLAAVEALPIPHNNVSTLRLQQTIPPNDPYLAASCLNRLFPQLSSVSLSTRFGHRTVNDQWEVTTKRVLQVLWGARGEERIRREDMVHMAL